MPLTRLSPSYASIRQHTSAYASYTPLTRLLHDSYTPLTRLSPTTRPLPFFDPDPTDSVFVIDADDFFVLLDVSVAVDNVFVNISSASVTVGRGDSGQHTPAAYAIQVSIRQQRMPAAYVSIRLF
jgi:hypothetical protein